MFKRFFKYFTIIEWVLIVASIAVITVGFAAGTERSILSFLSSIAGVVCVMLNAKGNVLGQVAGIVFAVLYSIYSYLQHYYGEMLIYVFLMIPIHIISIITWLRNKFDKSRHEVKINSLRPLEYVLTAFGAVCATVGFYFILSALNTDNLIVSTISLTTSITAAYLMLRRCSVFSILFIANDVVLVVLWSMKLATAGTEVLPSVLAFVMFLLNDSYCLISWQRIKRRQRSLSAAQTEATDQTQATEATEQTEETQKTDI